MRRYGSFRPRKTQMYGSSHSLCLNPTEGRGRALLLNRCSGQWYLKSIWKNAVERLQPNLVLDIGANYGEFLFLPEYSGDARVIGVEANPALSPFLAGSRDRHPNRDQIELIQSLIGADNDVSQTLHIDPHWSGRSSALQRIDDASAIEVPVASIDRILSERSIKPWQTLLFKIDVEGYERQVLEGMQETLGSAQRVVGILEYNEVLLRQAGGSPVALLEGLAERYSVYYFDAETRGLHIYDSSVGLPAGLQETDLLVLSDPALISQLQAEG